MTTDKKTAPVADAAGEDKPAPPEPTAAVSRKASSRAAPPRTSAQDDFILLAPVRCPAGDLVAGDTVSLDAAQAEFYRREGFID